MPRHRSRLFRDSRSPFWQAVWTDHQGGIHRQSTGCRDHGAAAAWLATRELERVKAGAGFPIARPIALLLASAEYITERKPFWSAWAGAVEGYFANSVVQHFGSDRIISSITRADVERFRARETTRPPRLSRCCKKPWRYTGEVWVCAKCGSPAPAGKTISGATVNRLMAAMGAFGRWCLVEGRGYHSTNPWARHEPLPEDEIAVPALEEDEIERVLKALEPVSGPLPQHGQRKWRAPWHLIFGFVQETGLRKAELGRITTSDVDKQTRTLFVSSTRQRGRTKSRHARPIPLSPRALEILKELPERDDGLVFGKIPDPRRAFATAAKATGLERVWLHLFRHLFASRLAVRGAGRHELRDAAGWSDSRMADRYTHARMGRLRELIEGPQVAQNPKKGRTRGGLGGRGTRTGDSVCPNRP